MEKVSKGRKTSFYKIPTDRRNKLHNLGSDLYALGKLEQDAKLYAFCTYHSGLGVKYGGSFLTEIEKEDDYLLLVGLYKDSAMEKDSLFLTSLTKEQLEEITAS